MIVYILIAYHRLSPYELLMWLSLTSLFLHQLEEYRIIGTFPGMVNKVVYKSEWPDKYPLNTNTSFLVNFLFGWTIYFCAALFAERAVWLGISALMISAGNILAHTFFFNLRGKTFYNAGLASSWLFFAPAIYFFVALNYHNRVVTANDLLIGIPLGIALNYVGIIKIIDWMADKKTPYIFEQRNLLPKDRIKKSDN